jgi:hypothetical protein
LTGCGAGAGTASTELDPVDADEACSVDEVWPVDEGDGAGSGGGGVARAVWRENVLRTSPMFDVVDGEEAVADGVATGCCTTTGAGCTYTGAGTTYARYGYP